MRAGWAALLLACAPLTAQEAMTRSVNRFGVDLYRKTCAQKGNLFFSPYSICAALAMTRGGARGTTAEQMDKVFSFAVGVGNEYRRLAKALEPPTGPEEVDGRVCDVPLYALNIANALWGQQGYRFHEAFLRTMREDFGAPLHQIDFTQQELARKTINDWVAEQTKKKIKDIVPDGLPAPDTRLALANAIYFKASWIEQFQKSATSDGPFHCADGSKVEAKLMRNVKHYGYAEDATVQLLEIDYRGATASMVIVLPKKRGALASVEAELSSDKLDRWLGALAPGRIDVTLPRFEFTASLELTSVLAALGMPDAFDVGKADFAGMTDVERLFIGAVLHKAFVAVDEDGTEAAAATVVMMRATGILRREEPRRFVADHPFLFLIRHKPTGCVLFCGRVANPVAG